MGLAATAVLGEQVWCEARGRRGVGACRLGGAVTLLLLASLLRLLGLRLLFTLLLFLALLLLVAPLLLFLAQLLLVALLWLHIVSGAAEIGGAVARCCKLCGLHIVSGAAEIGGAVARCCRSRGRSSLIELCGRPGLGWWARSALSPRMEVSASLRRGCGCCDPAS